MTEKKPPEPTDNHALAVHADAEIERFNQEIDAKTFSLAKSLGFKSQDFDHKKMAKWLERKKYRCVLRQNDENEDGEIEYFVTIGKTIEGKFKSRPFKEKS